MNRILLVVFSIFLSFSAFAKKVKFAVDMQNETVSAYGIHIIGDFSEAAGLGTNFAYLLPMVQEGTSSIYSVVLDLPAFRKYEYKFANGKLFYEVEFVPVESRVGYDFNDNRWIYVDSTANDTTYVGAIIYGANAPKGMYMARLIVDMTNVPGISPDGVHIGGTFNKWGEEKTQIISLENNAIYEGIIFIEQGSVHEYRFINGATLDAAEIVPAACDINNNRDLKTNDDQVFDAVCFSACTSCSPSGIGTVIADTRVEAVPNPGMDKITVNWDVNAVIEYATLIDMTGKIVRRYGLHSTISLEVIKDDLHAGIYLLHLKGSKSKTIKLVFL